MDDASSSKRPISKAVRLAFAKLIQRQRLGAPDVQSRWVERLDAPVPSDRTLRDLLSPDVDGGVTVEHLVRVSYCLDVSPGAVMDTAWREQPWDLLKLSVPGASVPRARIAEWLAGAAPLPGQNEVFFARHQPVTYLVLEGGPGLLGSVKLELHNQLERFLAAAASGDRAAMGRAGKDLQDVCVRTLDLVKRKGGLQGLDA